MQTNAEMDAAAVTIAVDSFSAPIVERNSSY